MKSPQLRGVAAGVPYVALAPPLRRADVPAVLGWHSPGTPGSATAMATSLPLARLPAWRVYLDLPWRQPDRPGERGGDPRGDGGGHIDADAVGRVARRTADQVSAALVELRQRLPVEGRPLGLLGASVGAVVAQLVGRERDLDVAAMALVSPATWGVDLLLERRPRPAVLVVTAADDDQRSRDHAVDLWQTLSSSNGAPERTSLVTVPHTSLTAHGPAGSEAAPALSAPAARVDAVLTHWFRRHLVP